MQHQSQEKGNNSQTSRLSESHISRSGRQQGLDSSSHLDTHGNSGVNTNIFFDLSDLKQQENQQNGGSKKCASCGSGGDATPQLTGGSSGTDGASADGQGGIISLEELLQLIKQKELSGEVPKGTAKKLEQAINSGNKDQAKQIAQKALTLSG
jgi:hypothetical protein